MKSLLILVTLLSTSAFGSSIQLRQDGWSAGGPLLVSFAGSDNDLDGALLTEELTQFRAIWQTPDGMLTEWGRSEIEPDGFIFADPGNFLIFIRNPEYSMVNSAFEGEFLATVFDAQLSPVATTTGAAQVVPEPGTFALFAALSAAVVAGRTVRRRGRRADASADVN